MNYTIITDSTEFQSFIDWLPDTVGEEAYYCSLLARAKYAKDLGIGTMASDRHQPARFASSKDKIGRKLKQLECEEGSYYVRGVGIPQQALASYITINPRCNYAASKLLLKNMADIVSEGRQHLDVNQVAMTALHKSTGRKLFAHFEFDVKGYSQVCGPLSNVINPNAVTIVVTRGGVHVLVKLSEVQPEYFKTWYKGITTIEGLDNSGDIMLPIPGTYQGGYTPWMFQLNTLF